MAQINAQHSQSGQDLTMQSERKTVLIVCYSDTGHTRDATEALDKALDATVEYLRAPLLDGHHGFWMFCWRALGAMFGRSVDIDPPQHDPAGFDLVVLATPIWAGRASTPIRAYLESFHRRFHNVAFVTTQSGASTGRALTDLASLTGQQPVATLSLSDADRHDYQDARKLADFAETLIRAVPEE